MNTNYEKDLNELKEQILKDGNTLVSKKDLLERFCEIDKEYNGEPWNLLQILTNINILVGEEPCENWLSRWVSGIVTCEDCKYNCDNTCTMDGCGIADDYFCASAERRE
jgi:hypothetical protein